MASAGADGEDEVSFLRTGDQLCLACASQTKSKDGTSSHVLLAGEGFGSRRCFLEDASNPNVPPDLSICMFVLEQAFSLRALQEMVMSDTVEVGGQGGHRTLLYGHAILLRHCLSDMYLACLSTVSSSDKLAFDVGLQEDLQGETCWWTIYPASKQRSEGEKVRVGDDLILVSVSSERYLHLSVKKKTEEPKVEASFQQTLWTAAPISSGSVKTKSMGFLNGMDVLRFSHGHLDEFLTVPRSGCKEDNSVSEVSYETGAVSSFARSLWRVELLTKKWNGSYVAWGQDCRIRHLTSGKYLSVTNSGDSICIVPRKMADLPSTVFCLRQSKEDGGNWSFKQEPGMGAAEIKYGDSTLIIQHRETGLWLSYLVGLRDCFSKRTRRSPHQECQNLQGDFETAGRP